MKFFSILLAILGSLTLTLAQAQSTFDANLDGLQEVPPNASPAFGFGDFLLSGTTLTSTNGSYSDLLGGASAVTINDAAVGASGPVLFTLTLDTPGNNSGTFSGFGTLTAGQITDLQAGNLYVNIRSSVFPSGEIRGQLLAVPEPGTLALAGVGVLTWIIKRRA
jgi:hypothetical protein